jgi:hypothetical protein
VVGKFNVSTGTVYQRNKPVLQFNMTEGEEFHIPSFSWMDERGEVIASQTTTTSDAAKPAPQELAATWHLNQLDGTEFTNTKSWMATEFAFAGNKRGTVNSDPITELQTSTRSLHEGRYALFLESEDAAYRSWADPAHEVLNYVGILDPFGVADGINAIWYVGEGLMGREGAFLNAGISAAGALLPYVGDLLKFGKAGVKAAEACGVFQKLETKAILKQSAKSAAIGAASGAAIGGTVSHVAGGDVWHGATQGALHGAVGGFSRGFFLNRFAQACFTAGTPLVVDLEGNSKPIEEIQVGEMVLARNEFEPHGPLELKRVEELFTRTSPIIELEIGGQKIGTTDEHPFYVPAREAFVPTRELQVGDQLVSHDGRLLRIDAIHSSLQIATVYNLRVADYHTYFVGSDEWGFSVWAHNVCKFTKIDGEGKPIFTSGLKGRREFETLRKANLTEPNNFPVIDHVNYRTSVGTSIKTIDLTSKYASDPKLFQAQIRTYVEKLRAFSGGVERHSSLLGDVRAPVLKGRKLEIGVQNGMLTKEQMSILRSEARRAERLKHSVQITVFEIT